MPDRRRDSLGSSKGHLRPLLALAFALALQGWPWCCSFGFRVSSPTSNSGGANHSFALSETMSGFPQPPRD